MRNFRVRRHYFSFSLIIDRYRDDKKRKEIKPTISAIVHHKNNSSFLVMNASYKRAGERMTEWIK